MHVRHRRSGSEVGIAPSGRAGELRRKGPASLSAHSDAGLGHNPEMPHCSPRLHLTAPSATPEEAAAVVAALERFMRATAAAPAAEPAEGLDGWRRAAMLEGVEREAQGDLSDPWINT